MDIFNVYNFEPLNAHTFVPNVIANQLMFNYPNPKWFRSWCGNQEAPLEYIDIYNHFSVISSNYLMGEDLIFFSIALDRRFPSKLWPFLQLSLSQSSLL